MTKTVDDQELQSGMQRLGDLLQEVDSIADPKTRAKVGQIIQGIMEFHGAAFTRILEQISSSAGAGRAAIDEMAKDELISSLFFLYGVHPQPLEMRVQAALDSARPYLASHGGNVELIGITDEGIVRLRMEGSCHGCPSSAVTMKLNIEKAIYERAPDVNGIQVEGQADHPSATPEPRKNGSVVSGFVPLENLISTIGKSHLHEGAAI